MFTMEFFRLKVTYAMFKRVVLFLECMLLFACLMAPLESPAYELALYFVILRVVTEGLNYWNFLEHNQLRDQYRLWPLQ